jgi:hypothetical protein
VEALSFTPDPWQTGVLRSEAPKVILNCCRQAGKSTIASILALHRSYFYAGSLVLLVSPSLRQSGELFRKVSDLLLRLPGVPERKEDNKQSVVLANGSRIVSLPSSESTVRGFSGVDLIILDESAWVDDALYTALRPMLAVSRGRMILMSTPHGRSGHFFNEWTREDSGWEKVRITAHDVPRIPKAFLDDERSSLGAWTFSQEYEGRFVEGEDQLFRYQDVMRAVTSEVEPLFAGVAT